MWLQVQPTAPGQLSRMGSQRWRRCSAAGPAVGVWSGRPGGQDRSWPAGSAADRSARSRARPARMDGARPPTTQPSSVHGVHPFRDGLGPHLPEGCPCLLPSETRWSCGPARSSHTGPVCCRLITRIRGCATTMGGTTFFINPSVTTARPVSRRRHVDGHTDQEGVAIGALPRPARHVDPLQTTQGHHPVLPAEHERGHRLDRSPACVPCLLVIVQRLVLRLAQLLEAGVPAFAEQTVPRGLRVPTPGGPRNGQVLGEVGKPGRPPRVRRRPR